MYKQKRIKQKKMVEKKQFLTRLETLKKLVIQDNMEISQAIQKVFQKNKNEYNQKKKTTRWLPKEERTMKTMLDQKKNFEQIAKKLKTTKNRVHTKYYNNIHRFK